MLTNVVFFLCILIDAIQGRDCPGDTSQLAHVRLRNDLLCGYEKAERPVLHHKDPVSVGLKMIVKYFDYNIHEDSFTIESWMALYWKDAHLKWNPGDYESLKSIRLSESDIWMPDISVYNRRSQSGSAAVIESITCLVSSDGGVVCVPPVQHNSLCVSDISKYPFDTHNCTVKFGSWVHTGEEMDLKVSKESVSVEDLQTNGEWELLDHDVVKNPGNYKCCPNNTYPSVSFSFLIRRIAGSYTASLILPSLALVMMTLTSLWIAPNKPTRLSLCYVNIICEFIHVQYVSWTVPSNGENVPLILVFARDSLLLSMFVAIFSIILSYVVDKKTPTPGWVSVTVSVLTAFKPGQFILLDEESAKAIAKGDNDEDGTAILGGQESNPQAKDWLLFTKIMDRVCFFVFCVAYIIMFVRFTP